MLKQTVQYEDYNDVTQSETLYFNLTKTELMDLIDLQPRLEAWGQRTSGGTRELTTEEIKELLDIIKLLIEKSYGVRSEDGKHFRKSDSIFDDFKQSAAYDAFVFSMFENPDSAVSFMTGILPKNLPGETPVQSVALPKGELNGADKEVPAWIREDRDPTPKELQSMSQEEMRAAFQRKSLRNLDS